MAANYGTIVERTGAAARSLKSFGAHIFKRAYYEQRGSGDMRGEYIDGIYSAPGASGETMRLRGIANALLSATGGTINALHATGRVAAGKTVSGALNAIRATLEVAGTNPTPGGTLAAIQLDSNLPSGTTLGANDAFARVSNSGAVGLTNLFNIESAPASNDHTALVSTNADTAATHIIKIRVNGATLHLLATNNPA